MAAASSQLYDGLPLICPQAVVYLICRAILKNRRSDLPTIVIDVGKNVFLTNLQKPHVCEPRAKEDSNGMQVRREAIAQIKKKGGRTADTYNLIPIRVLEKQSKETEIIRNNIRAAACGDKFRAKIEPPLTPTIEHLKLHIRTDPQPSAPGCIIPRGVGIVSAAAKFSCVAGDSTTHPTIAVFVCQLLRSAGASMIGGSSSGLHQSSRHLFGLLLLVVVNVLWVASAELTRVIFVDDSFRRPFFVTYVKTCLLVVYFLRFWICGPSQTVVTETQLNGAKYSLLQDSEDEYEPEALTSPEFEPVTTVVSDAEALQEDPSSPSREKRFRKVRFSLMREVRRLPSAIADEARKARLPYRPPTVECSLKFSPMTKCTIALAPLWLVCSMTYQTALMFTTVSAVNLLSASSSLLVLVLAAFFGRRPSDRFTCRKLFLVLLNLVGVAVVSGFSNSGAGAFLALGSAITYAVYLTSYQAVCDKFGAIDMNLLFGVIGLASILAGTPLLYVLHISGIEKLTPWPSGDEWSVLLASALFGTVISDYLCLYATALTGPLTASLSFTLSIPLSILADVLFRHRPPTSLQMLAAVPIVFSFAGAALVGRSVASDQSGHATKTSDMEMRERADFERENLMRAVYANDVEDDDGDLLFAKNQFV